MPALAIFSLKTLSVRLGKKMILQDVQAQLVSWPSGRLVGVTPGSRMRAEERADEKIRQKQAKREKAGASDGSNFADSAML